MKKLITLLLLIVSSQVRAQDLLALGLIGIADAVIKDKELPLYGIAFHPITKEEKKRMTKEAYALNYTIRDNPGRPELLVRRGVLKKQIGVTDGALEDFDKALKLKTTDTEVDFYRAEVWMWKGHRYNALFNIDRYIKKQPDSAKGYFQRGLIITYNPAMGSYSFKDRCNESILEYGKALAIDPNHRGCLILRGYSYQSTGQFDLAIVDYKKALEVYPNDPLVYFLLGVTYEKKKDLINACESFKLSRQYGKDIPDRFIRRNCE
jgi:tetratricopeptide (TPR) repeat protein